MIGGNSTEGVFEGFGVTKRLHHGGPWALVPEGAQIGERCNGGLVHCVVGVDLEVVRNGSLDDVDCLEGIFPVGTIGEDEIIEFDREQVDVVHVSCDGGHGRVLVKDDEQFFNGRVEGACRFCTACDETIRTPWDNSKAAKDQTKINFIKMM